MKLSFLLSTTITTKFVERRKIRILLFLCIFIILYQFFSLFFLAILFQIFAYSCCKITSRTSFRCRHYAAKFSGHVLSDDIFQRQLTNQLLTSSVSCESREEGGNILRFLRDTPFWIVSLQQGLNEAVSSRGFNLFRRRIFQIFTSTTTKMSLCRQNYHEECEAGINKQINLELYASYVYMSMVGFLLSDRLFPLKNFI